MAGALKVRVGGAWQIIPGPVGPIGPQGIQGVQGPIGNTGPQGIQGVIGPKGDKGDQGIQGIQGIQGPIGNTGLQGIQGVQGPIGLTGPGVKPGGTTGQLLIKQSNADYDTAWLTTSGTGNVLGPASSVANRIAVFSDTSGKVIADSGVSLAGGTLAFTNVANVFTANQTFTGQLTKLSAANPDLGWYNTAAGVDTRYCKFQAAAGNLMLYMLNDADSAIQSVPLTVYRSGKVTFGGQVQLTTQNPAIQFGGTTAAFPGLRNTGQELDVVSADATVWAPLKAMNFLSYGVGNNLADLTVTGAATVGTTLGVTGRITAYGGVTGNYAQSAMEVQTVGTPRISFHWPGVVASQIGMDSAGTIRTFDNPGTGFAPFSCGRLYASQGMMPRIWQMGPVPSFAPNENYYDFISIWAQNQTLSILAGGGSVDGFPWTLRIRDDGVARALSWDGNYMSVCGVALPTATTASRTLHIGFRWNVYYGRWQMIALAQE